jgi:hypothetical protein
MATATEKKVGYQIKTGRTFKDRAAAGRALVWGKGIISEEDIKKIKNVSELLLKYREELERIEKVSGIGINHLASMIKHDLADIKYRQVDPKSGLLLSVIEKQKIKEAAKKAKTAPESKKVTEKKTKKGKEKSAEKNSKGAAPKSEENHNQEAEIAAMAAEMSADLDVKPSKAEEAVRKVMKRRK